MVVDQKLIIYKFEVGSTKLDPMYLNDSGLLMTTTLFVSISVCGNNPETCILLSILKINEGWNFY